MRGDLTRTPVNTLLLWVKRDKKTGLLGLEAQAERYALSFVAGRLVECYRHGAAAAGPGWERGREPGELLRILRVPLAWNVGQYVFQDMVPDPAAPAGVDPCWLLAQARTAAQPAPQAATPDARPAPADQSGSPLTRMVAATLLRKDYQLPVLSTAALRIGQLSSDPKASLSRAAEAIAADPALSAAVLRCANSASNSRGQRIESIPMAMALLGFRTLLALAMSVCVHSRKLRDPRLQKAQAALYRHSLCVALFARHLAAQFRLDDEQAFLCGLMHDMGKAVLLGIADDMLLDLAKKGQGAGLQVLEGLEALLSQHHCEVGRVLCTKWELPESVCQTVAYHHEPERAETDGALVAVVALANTLLNGLERGEALPEASLLVQSSAARFLEIGLQRAEGLGAAAAHFMEQGRELVA